MSVKFFNNHSLKKLKRYFFFQIYYFFFCACGLMYIQQYLDEMKKVQCNLLDFLESFTDIKEKFQNLISTMIQKLQT